MERNENGYSAYNFSQNGTFSDRRGCSQSGGCDRRGGCGSENGTGGMTNGQCNANDFENARLAMAYVPMQVWRMLYSPDSALMRGTMFEELDLPLEDCVND